MSENISPNIMSMFSKSSNSSKAASSSSSSSSTSTAFSHSPKPAKANKSIEETYIKLSHLDQILTRPDTYIGSIEAETEPTWIWDMKDSDCGNCSSSDDDEKGSDDVETLDDDDDDNYSDTEKQIIKKKRKAKKSSGSKSSDDVLKGRMITKDCTIVPGLFKIFDEILVNAADHRQRDKSMKTLKVEINVEKNCISVYNDGTGIPIQMHKGEKVYVPELIFGQLLTSSNYNDNEKKTVGGKNGYGAKLANIFSKTFIVETVDSSVGKYYYQKYTDNMKKRYDPIIKPYEKKSYTKITFYPDLERFQMKELDDDIVGVMVRRVVDIAGTSKAGLKVYYNDKRVEISSFDQYASLYLTDEQQCFKEHCKIPFKALDDKESSSKKSSAEKVTTTAANSKDYWWEVVVSVSEDYVHQHVSFVNSINTSKGGTHVSAITEQITKYIVEFCSKKHKLANVKPGHVKQNLFVFVNCLIVNPSFDSQTKTNMTTKKGSFGSSCELDEKFLKKLVSGSQNKLLETILSQADKKNANALNKQNAKKSTGRLRGIAKLDDANSAGTKHGHECTLILTEGDSAKALAVAGLSVIGRDKFGVFPLKGKLLNVREVAKTKVRDNQEISHLVQILGLRHGHTYTSTRDNGLRYGHVMIMTDQDHDGSHIKGLVINLFATFWPSLLRLNGYLREFITPIVKASKGSSELAFYTIPEYETWKKENNDGKGWKLKYYKGLGTSTSSEAKQYFTDIGRHDIEFQYRDITDEECFEMAFAKDTDKRKEWLSAVEPNTYLDQNVDKIRYRDFVYKELSLYGLASVARAVPSVVDGLKPGQRKILFTALKFKLVKEIKVAQLAGLVSKEASYHHGEQSLASTIVGLAQNFVGSNNINYFYPAGQFGTRLAGGQDAASARYIFTHLTNVTRALFPADDDQLLNYLNDDGQSIEPQYYVPIIPTVLVNGSSGIATGWSSTVSNYNPREIIRNIRLLLDGQNPVPMLPWYKGFKGAIIPRNSNSFTVFGRVSKLEDNTYHISELPVGEWTNKYKASLDEWIEKGIIKDFKEYHTDVNVSFVITITDDQVAAAQSKGFYKFFKLESSLSSANMMLFDPNGKLKRYDSPLDILRDFYTLRLEYYVKRKAAMTQKLEQELSKLTEKVRFILAVVKDELNIRNIKKAVLLQRLVKDKYTPFPKQTKKEDLSVEQAISEEEDEAKQAESDDVIKVEEKGRAVKASDYDYLLNMPLWSLTLEKVEELTKERDEKASELEALQKTSTADLWKRDLDTLEVALDEHERLELEEGGRKKKTVTPFKSKSNTKLASKAAGPKNKEVAEGELIDPPTVNFSETSPNKRVKKEKGVKVESSDSSDSKQRTLSTMFDEQKVKKENGEAAKKERTSPKKKAAVKKEKLVLQSEDSDDDVDLSLDDDLDVDDYLESEDSNDDDKPSKKGSKKSAAEAAVRRSPNRRAATQKVNYKEVALGDDSEEEVDFNDNDASDDDEVEMNGVSDEEKEEAVKPPAKKAAAAKPAATKTSSSTTTAPPALKPLAASPNKKAAAKKTTKAKKLGDESDDDVYDMIDSDVDEVIPKRSSSNTAAAKKPSSRSTAATNGTSKPKVAPIFASSSPDIDASDVNSDGESSNSLFDRLKAKSTTSTAAATAKPSATTSSKSSTATANGTSKAKPAAKRKSDDEDETNAPKKKAKSSTSAAPATKGKNSISSFFTKKSEVSDAGDSDVDISMSDNSDDEYDFKASKKDTKSKETKTKSSAPAAKKAGAKSSAATAGNKSNGTAETSSKPVRTASATAAAAATKKKSIYVESDEDEDMYEESSASDYADDD